MMVKNMTIVGRSGLIRKAWQ